MESERPGSRRPGQGGRPGNRPAGALAEQVELTVAHEASPAEETGAGTGPPARLRADLEQAIRHLPALQEAARAAGLEAAREETRAFLRLLERDLRAARIEDRAHALEALQTAAEEVSAAGQGMDILMSEASARAEETTTVFQAGCEDVLRKVEEVRDAAERMADEGTTRAEEQMKRLRSATTQAVEEARGAAWAASWRPWVMSTACALALTLGVSLLRPGWTMSSGQRRAERVGETVIRAYEAASPAERAQMRKVMGWRDPSPVDTTSAAARR